MKNHKGEEYAFFQKKIMRRFCFHIFASVFIVLILYLFFWRQRFGDWIVSVLECFPKITHEQAFYIYHNYFRGYREVFFAVAIILIFVFMAWRLFRWMSRYFKEIDQGIDELLKDDAARICLSLEMLPFERKLNAVKKELQDRKAEKANAERRKDELVMYLAHDIRTPLTSVIGYLSLLEEEPDMPMEQRARHVHITLEKANRLEEMINEFFEITRLNSGQIQLVKEAIDLCYMLVQLCDEASPALDAHGNSVVLDIQEDLTVYADPDKMARVFGNILKNAAAYSFPGTEIHVSARRTETDVIMTIQNRGKTIPPEKLSLLFDKFYRLDSSRVSDTGGTGLGLAIAKEIVSLHDGKIEASSENETVSFTVRLPLNAEIIS